MHAFTICVYTRPHDLVTTSTLRSSYNHPRPLYGRSDHMARPGAAQCCARLVAPPVWRGQFRDGGPRLAGGGGGFFLWSWGRNGWGKSPPLDWGRAPGGAAPFPALEATWTHR